MLLRLVRHPAVSQKIVPSRSIVSSHVHHQRRTRKRGIIVTGGFSAFALCYWAWDSLFEETRQLGTHSFVPAQLTSSEQTTKDTKLLRFSFPHGVLKDAPKMKPIWSFYVKDSDIQVERPYTPLEGLSSTGEISLWVKKYQHGEVGRWLHSRPVGEYVEMRGPVQTWLFEEGKWDTVIMLSGGTGITPFYQLLSSIFGTAGQANSSTSFILLQSYRSSKDLPPKFVSDNLMSWVEKSSGKLRMSTFVDDPEDKDKEGLKVGRFGKAEIEMVLKHSRKSKTLILICGPDHMVSALAGPKGRDQTQGSIQGVLKELAHENLEVWKL